MNWDKFADEVAAYAELNLEKPDASADLWKKCIIEIGRRKKPIGWVQAYSMSHCCAVWIHMATVSRMRRESARTIVEFADGTRLEVDTPPEKLLDQLR